MAITKYKGTLVEFSDGVSRIVPALTLRHVQALQSRLIGYTGELDKDSVELVVDTVHASLSRNYPEITRDDVGEIVDLNNMAKVMQAVMGASGLVEAAPSGEAVAAE